MAAGGTGLALGVVVIARNEERDLPGFLQNVLPWADELVIVDDESTDATAAIAQAAGSKVTVVRRAMETIGGFAAQRNAGIDAARADWLLHMDVDERVTPELAREIRRATREGDRDAYRFRRLNFFLHRPMRGGGWQRWNHAHLARRGRHRFAGAIHEQCVVDGGDSRTGQLRGHMWHLNDEDYVERVGKNLRYMQYSGEEIVARGIRVRWYHLLGVPLWRGLRSYVLDGGFREGTRGLLFAQYTASSVFNWWAHAWDLQNRIPREQLEDELGSIWREAADPPASPG
jgi:glycosyltransferase involved in cell wall biosynthesis